MLIFLNVELCYLSGPLSTFSHSVTVMYVVKYVDSLKEQGAITQVVGCLINIQLLRPTPKLDVDELTMNF